MFTGIAKLYFFDHPRHPAYGVTTPPPKLGGGRGWYTKTTHQNLPRRN